MRQLRMEWTEQRGRDDPDEVVLDPETTATVITLMSRALVDVVRAAHEVDDER